jgi:ABC-type branched-subunit amino acid transport system ATPase component
MNKDNNIISVDGLYAGYGNDIVLKNICFDVQAGEVMGIIGPNGCGKSTLLKCLYGLVKPHKGSIAINGLCGLSLEPHQMRSSGVAFFMQGGLIFPTLTVAEHLMLVKPSYSSSDRIFSYFPALKKLLSKSAGVLSGGERQILSLSMLLMHNANIWLIDEPSSGLSAENAAITFDFLREINSREGITMLIVEHNHSFVFNLSTSTLVINEGVCTSKLTPEYVRNNLDSLIV